jgi:hypothetical protein
MVGAGDGPIVRRSALIQVNADRRVAIMMSAKQAPIPQRPAAVAFSDPALAAIRVDFRR